MEYRTLGRSGLAVSTLVLGTMTFGGDDPEIPVGYTPPAEARRIVDRCLDAGVNLIDTADLYKDGASEELLGEVLAGRRERVLLATKARFPVGPGPNEQGLSRYHLIRACEASLRRLRADHIDLYQLHEWDGVTPLEETLDALDTLVHQGKVRYVGCSNYSAWHVMKALGLADRLGLTRFVSQQSYYSLIGRDVEAELVPLGVDQGLGMLVWSPLAGGLLTGKYRRDAEGPAGARHSRDWSEPPIADWDRVWDVVEAVVEVADARRGGGASVTPAQVALAWLLGRPGVTGVVIGCRTDEQAAANLAAADVVLADDERAKLDAVSLPELRYPYWHQLVHASARLSPADRTLLDQYR